MGSIILCHKKKAKHPYEITRVHRYIYTIEELCYYLCSYLYLVDYTIMNEKLCDWLEAELQLHELSEQLRQNLKQNGSPEQFISMILAHSSIYTTAELKQMQELMEQLKHQKPVEKQKFKADRLLESGVTRQAIFLYQSILQNQEDDSVDKKFYGSVYACLGAAYGRMFLYEEAAKMYQEAYNICEDKGMLKAYLYASSRYLSADDYQALLKTNRIYQQMQFEILEMEQNVAGKIQALPDDSQLKEWKEEYRRNG